MTSQPRRRQSSSRGQAHRYEIRDATGVLVAIHVRIDKPDGTKRMWWELPGGTKGLGTIGLADLPLYGTHRLGDWPAPTIVVVEGEKAADALVAVGIPALGTVTGAASCPGPAALAELTGRHLILWPDNDNVGRKHMHRMAERMARIPASVSLVEWPEASEHGDAADFLDGGKTAEDVLALLEGALEQPSIEIVEADATDLPGGAGRRSQLMLDQLLVLAARADLFHTPERETYADVRVVERRETWPIQSAGFADWLRRECWAVRGQAPREPMLKDAVAALGATALYDGQERPVFLRAGRADPAIYVDLGDPAWQAVEISATGWRIVVEPPVRFRRGGSALALPEPIRGGSLEELRPFLNLPDDPSWRLCCAYVVFAHWPPGAQTYPALALGGQQDSGKSTTARVLRELVDPDTIPLISPPRDEEDLMVVAADNRLPVFDNLSHLEPWLSDAFCRILDGTGFKRRARYKDRDVAGLRPHCPVIFNGIGELVTRGDLLNRTILFTLPTIEDASRRSETEFRSDFEAARPRILGAIYDAIAGVLAILDTVRLERPPRLADFARVGVALERVLGWPEGSFLAALEANRAVGHELALESYPIVGAILSLAHDHRRWEGSMSQLLEELRARATEAEQSQRRWPGAPHILSSQLDRVAPSLRAKGLEVEHGRTRGGSWARVRERSSGESSVTASHVSPANVDSAPNDPGGASPEASPPVDGSVTAGHPVTPVTLRDASLAMEASRPGERRPTESGAENSVPEAFHDAVTLPSSKPLREKKGEERSSAARGLPSATFVQAALTAGKLDGFAFSLGPGEIVSDPAMFARISLAELSRPGRIGELARERLERLAEALQAAKGAG